MQPQTTDSSALHVTAIQMPADRSPSRVDGASADIALLEGARLLARRGEDVIRYGFPRIPGDDDLLHPYLAPGAALAWQWRGREALHAGAFATDSGAVLLFGAKESGKSTTLAWLVEHFGVTVMADDLAVIDRDRVLAGPRTIDLRAAAAARANERQVQVRDGQRARLSLPPAPASQPVIGCVVLGWGERLTITRVPPSERIAVLAAHRTYRRLDAESRSLLDLAARPMFAFARPRVVDSLPETSERASGCVLLSLDRARRCRSSDRQRCVSRGVACARSLAPKGWASPRHAPSELRQFTSFCCEGFTEPLALPRFINNLVGLVGTRPGG